VISGGLGSRDRALGRLAASRRAPLDLLVVGGGITGAGIALDAASRGLRTGLVERFDFASGTSSKSSKLVHGGLRYLEQREFSLVREASTERELLGRLAPQLVETVPFVIPVSQRWLRAKFGVGLWAYDALASFKNTALHRYIDTDRVEALMPPLPKGKVRGGYLYHDSKTDDVRLVMEVLIQAVRLGATVTNHAAVRDLDGSDEMCSALIEDTVTSEVFEVRARRIIVAAGVWADRVESLAKDGAAPRLRPSKGVHLVFRREQLPMEEAAGFIPDAERTRMLFVIPWLDSVIVGTTDTPYSGDIDHPSVDPEDRRYCLEAVNSAFDLDLTEDDVAGAWAGLRPLIAAKADETADLSRSHAVYDIAPGIVGITGGKLTTYRRMAQDAVDRVAEDLDNRAKSRTRWIKLGCSNLGALELAVGRRAQSLGIPPRASANLVRCYGDRALAVLDVAAETGLAGELAPGHLPLAAEALYCAGAEMAVQLSDFLARRTRLALTDPAAGISSTNQAAEVMAEAHGWSGDELVRQIEAHRIDIEQERGTALAERPIAAPRLPTAGTA
jgi:glycerol-3-phosphate dehydrogenase